MTRHDMSDTSRDPCPYIIVYDVGVGFSMGVIGGGIWHAFKGYRNSPRGDRLAGTLSSIKARAPVVGGSFAVWSGLFNAGDCTLVALRGKEDSWNAIMAGAATGGILAARSGPKTMLISALFGGIILGVMEGVGAMITRMSSDQFKPVRPEIPGQQQQQSSGPVYEPLLNSAAAESSSSPSASSANTSSSSAQPAQSATAAAPAASASPLSFGFFPRRQQ